jgi:hypothetical protein
VVRPVCAGVPGSRRDLSDVSRPGLRDRRDQHRQPR